MSIQDQLQHATNPKQLCVWCQCPIGQQFPWSYSEARLRPSWPSRYAYMCANLKCILPYASSTYIMMSHLQTIVNYLQLLDMCVKVRIGVRLPKPVCFPGGVCVLKFGSEPQNPRQGSYIIVFRCVPKIVLTTAYSALSTACRLSLDCCALMRTIVYGVQVWTSHMSYV